jgi:hypothetical protein
MRADHPIFLLAKAQTTSTGGKCAARRAISSFHKPAVPVSAARNVSSVDGVLLSGKELNGTASTSLRHAQAFVKWGHTFAF